MTDLIETISIDASPATVWSVLAATDRYPEWNPLIRYDGSLQEGSRPRVRLRLPGLPAIYTRPRVLTIAPERELRWQTRLPGLTAIHTFRLDDPSDSDDSDDLGESTDSQGRTRFAQTERFEGALAGPVAGRFERASRRGFRQMNLGLKRRAERLAAER